jgi:hypothetical protein
LSTLYVIGAQCLTLFGKAVGVTSFSQILQVSGFRDFSEVDRSTLLAQNLTLSREESG